MSPDVDAVLDLLAIAAPRRRKIQSIADLEALIEQGLPGKSLTAVRHALETPVGRFVEVLGISPRSFSNMESNQRLSVVVSDRLARIARVTARSEAVFGDRAKAIRWMQTPCVALGGRTPFEKMITESGAARVEDVLAGIEHGVYV